MMKYNKSVIELIIISVILIGFFSLLFIIAFKNGGFDESVRSLLDIMIGSLGMSVGTIVNYFFGSSSSSRNKDDVISHLKIKEDIK
jgi:hypothetical protein